MYVASARRSIIVVVDSISLLYTLEFRTAQVVFHGSRNSLEINSWEVKDRSKFGPNTASTLA